MTANAKPSWMPELTEILNAIYNAEEPSVAVESLISRAALDKALTEIIWLTGAATHSEFIAAARGRIESLRAEREALP